jgi:HK97 family phage major capsid protein
MTPEQKEMDKLFKQMEGVRLQAEKEGRGLTAAEIEKRAGIKKKIEALVAGRESNKEEEELRGILYGTGSTGPLTMEGLGDEDRGDPGVMVFQDAEGRSIEAFSNSKRFSTLKGEERIEGIGPGSLGKILRAKILGDPLGLSPSEIRALGESVGGAGGWFVSPALSSYVIDLARNKSCVLLAGGFSLPMTTEEMTLVKVLTDPTAYWVAEHAKITESEGTFGPIKLKAMVVGCLVRVSRALLEDAPNSGNVIETQIGAALGLEIDRCALLGNGVNEPKGLSNCAGINTYSMGANGLALANYDPFSYAVQYVAEDNGLATAVIMAPRTAGALDRLKEGTTLAPLTPPPSFQALQKFSTNQIPITQTQGTATTASSAFVGDYKNIVLGMRKQLTIDIAASGVGSGSVDVFSSVETLIRGYLRIDVAVLRENHFTWIKGIL